MEEEAAIQRAFVSWAIERSSRAKGVRPPNLWLNFNSFPPMICLLHLARSKEFADQMLGLKEAIRSAKEAFC